MCVVVSINQNRKHEIAYYYILDEYRVKRSVEECCQSVRSLWKSKSMVEIRHSLGARNLT
jgi:hypothetical protein